MKKKTVKAAIPEMEVNPNKVQRDKKYDKQIPGTHVETHIALGISNERCDELARVGVSLILEYAAGNIGLAQAMEEACSHCVNANEIAFQCLGMGRSMENPMTQEYVMIKRMADMFGGKENDNS